jgi:hypothetical protein
MYFQIETNKLLTESEVRSLYPNTSFPTPFSPPEGIVVVFESPTPTVNQFQTYILDGVTIDTKGNYVKNYKTVDKFQDQLDESGNVIKTKAEFENEVLVEQQTQLIKSLTDTIQKHLDDTAIEYGYDSILSMCTYATSTDEQFRTQGQRAVEFRDAVWNAAIGIMNDVKSGAIETPNSETLIGMLPAF